MAEIDLNTLIAALRAANTKIKTLEKGTEEIKNLLQKQADAPRWIEDIPGRRVPYTGVIDLTIAANSTSRVEGVLTLSTDGPFVCTGVAMYFQRTAGSYDGCWGPATTFDARMAAANAGDGFENIFDQPHIGSFDVELSEAGSDRNWQNSAFASALFSPQSGGVYVLPVANVFGRSSVVSAKVTPSVAQTVAGKVQVLLLGYKIVQGDVYQP